METIHEHISNHPEVSFISFAKAMSSVPRNKTAFHFLPLWTFVHLNACSQDPRQITRKQLPIWHSSDYLLVMRRTSHWVVTWLGSARKNNLSTSRNFSQNQVRIGMFWRNENYPLQMPRCSRAQTKMFARLSCQAPSARRNVQNWFTWTFWKRKGLNLSLTFHGEMSAWSFHKLAWLLNGFDKLCFQQQQTNPTTRGDKRNLQT